MTEIDTRAGTIMPLPEKKKDTLDSLVSQYEALAQKLAEGELTPELENELMSVDVKLPKKVQGYATILDRLEIEAEAFSSKAAKYHHASQAIDNLRDRIKDHLKNTMQKLDVTELNGIDVKFKLSPAKPSVVVDLTVLPEDYKKHVTTISADKEKIRTDLENKKEIPGAKLEPSFSLRQYVKKTS